MTLFGVVNIYIPLEKTFGVFSDKQKTIYFRRRKETAQMYHLQEVEHCVYDDSTESLHFNQGMHKVLQQE